MRPPRHRTIFAVILAALGGADPPLGADDWTADADPAGDLASLVTAYCIDCHDDPASTLALREIAGTEVGRHPIEWEKVVRKLRSRQMPPAGTPRPDETEYEAILSALETALDAAAAEHPDPGRTETFRRLTRTEYQNAIRDLLSLDVDAAAWLPPDEAGHGFDNVTVGGLSPTLLDRYVTAAQRISSLAVGRSGRSPGGETIRIPADRTQEGHVEGLPLGTRGGAVIPYTFPQDGEYEVQIRLTRDRNEEVEGLREPHELVVLLDREQVASFTVTPPADASGHATVDAHLETRMAATAGPHDLGVTFLKNPFSLPETKRQPYQAHFNMHRHPRLSPAVYQVSIVGPFEAKGPGETPSRRRLFACRPEAADDEEVCATRVLTTVMRRAYRRPVGDEDLAGPMKLYREGRADGDFDAGIEAALSGVLVSPRFLFRIEHDPSEVAPGTAYRLSDLELASRLSFFLWSSIPDDELLDAAESGRLSNTDEFERQVRRMLADPRSESLTANFASQWLHLRNLASTTPDLRLFPDFDDNLRQSFLRETELLFDEVVREDLSVLDLLKPGHTFLNERLAKHYGVPHVYGERFRRVELGDGSERGGLLRQGSVLTVTSYATRTSPVIRGKWVLENLLGSPPPPPPPDVPALKDKTVTAGLSVRARLAEHRADAACASCHNLMDPVGFSLENFDAVGRWRTAEGEEPVDAAGGLPDGSRFDGVAGLERAILGRPELFAGAMTEKLLTYALGRGIEASDAPAVRKIVRDAEANGYRFSSIVLGIAKSVPFQMRLSE